MFSLAKRSLCLTIAIAMVSVLGRAQQTPAPDTTLQFNFHADMSAIDSTDSTVAEINIGGWHKKRRSAHHAFLIPDLENTRQFTYRESFGLIDFNRVDGFFLGLGSSSMADFGKHDEFGIS